MRMTLAREIPKARASALIDSPAWCCLAIAPLLFGRADRAAHGLALRLRTRQAGLGAFHQQVALHLGDGSQHVQHELAGGTGQVELAQLQDDDLDAARGQCLIVAPMSCASRPRRSSSVTTNVSPSRIWLSILANCGRWKMAVRVHAAFCNPRWSAIHWAIRIAAVVREVDKGSQQHSERRRRPRAEDREPSVAEQRQSGVVQSSVVAEHG